MTRQVGVELAETIAALLEAGVFIHNYHQAYCGMGLRYVDGCFIYDAVEDGWLLSEEDLRKMGPSGPSQRRVFATREAFVGWLSVQTDESLSGREMADPWYHGNQRITIKRLEAAVAFCRDNPESDWPTYFG